jgi:DNA-binding PadR family transcriptional regulator
VSLPGVPPHGLDARKGLFEGRSRRVFRLTEAGKAEAERRKVMQVARTGTPQEVAGAKEILAETRKSLYRLLAGDDPA